MKTYEVKFAADGQDYKEFQKSNPKEAYEAFLKDNDNYLDVPVEVWEGLDKVATFTRHLHGDHHKPIAQYPESSSSSDHTQEEILKQLKLIKLFLFIGVLYFILVVSGIIPAGIFS